MNAVGQANIFEQLGLSRSLQSERRSELGQAEFLDLMVTQLKNQDPFSPMESGEFLGQLAQFGTVTGIDNLESELQKLSASLSSNQALQAATLLDREVLVSSDLGSLVAGQELKGVVDLPYNADQLKVDFYDTTGRLIKQLNLANQPAGQVSFAWDGLLDDGSSAPAGMYELRAEASSGGVNQAVEALVASRVESVTLGRSGETLMVDVSGLGRIDFSEIREIS
jgi:flagellar basal-body rod modification protein FlgD